MTANAAAAWSSAAAALHALALRLGVASAQIGAYLPFLPAAAAALQSALGTLPLPSLSLAGGSAIYAGPLSVRLFCCLQDKDSNEIYVHSMRVASPSHVVSSDTLPLAAGSWH